MQIQYYVTSFYLYDNTLSYKFEIVFESSKLLPHPNNTHTHSHIYLSTYCNEQVEYAS